MRLGHFIALVGAVLALIGGTVLDWQLFETAGVIAKGYQVPPAGQIVVGLAALIFLVSAIGLLTRKRKESATATVIIASFALAWVALSHTSRASNFTLMQYETVEMLGGYTLAAIGAFLMFFGPLVVFATEPGMDPNAQFLRVALLWNGTVIQEKVLQEPQTFTIGEGLKNDMIMPADRLPARFPLFSATRKGDYSIGIAKDIQGHITVNQETHDIHDFAAQATDTRDGVGYVPIHKGDWGIVELGEAQIFFQFVQPDRRIAKAFFAFDEYVAASVSASAAIQLLFLIYAATIGWQESAQRELVVNKKQIMDVEVHVKDAEKKEEEELAEDEEDDSTAKKAEGEEGKFGDPDEDPEKESKIPKNDGKMVNKIDPKKVGLNDLLSTNKLGGSGAIASILSASSDGFSNKIAVAMAGSGSEFVLGHGAGGLGFAGTGSGGGGEGGYGRIHGMGKIDTGGGMGVKAGLGKKGQRHVGQVKLGGSSSRGFCKKSNISSVVRRRAGAIRACYEKRLQTKPKLSGKINARWTITMDGSVTAVAASGSMSDAQVTNCVLRVLRRMRFAKPEGGICVVQWPFVFTAGG
jgi:hypothetical protein